MSDNLGHQVYLILLNSVVVRDVFTVELSTCNPPVVPPTSPYAMN